MSDSTCTKGNDTHMVTVPFSKYHGLGNDYLFIDTIAHPELRGLPFHRLAAAMSHRRLGPGADGIVIIQDSSQAVIAMRIFNSDGSEAETCGNALRCLARICHERRYTAALRFFISTPGGISEVDLNPEDSDFSRVGLKLKPPLWHRSTLPMTGDGDTLNLSLTIGDHDFDIACLSVGNPHCVIFLSDFSNQDVIQWGPVIECHPWFPNRINAGFCTIVHRQLIKLTVWERGAGLTGACGTGAAAAFAAARKRNLVDPAAIVVMPGGQLSFNDQDGAIRMEGPASHVYDGMFAFNPEPSV